MPKEKKGGQVTLFIILGILLVAIVAFGVGYYDWFLLSSWDREKKEAMTVPEQARKVNDYIYSCIEGIGHEGLTIVGLQGGYINLPKSSMPKSPLNPFYNYLEIMGGSRLKVPYWYYRKANGVESYAVPQISEIENQLSVFMNENLASCISNFSIFPQYKFKAGKISTETKIDPDRVRFTVMFPVHLEIDSFDFDFNKFYSAQEVKLGQMYTAAQKIMEAENKDFFLEELAIDSLVLYEEVPFSGIGFTCKQDFWTKTEVKNEIKKILEKNVPFVKLGQMESALKGKRNEYFLWDALEKNYPGIRTNFLYSKNWPINMDIEPSEGEILKTDQLLDTVGMNKGVALVASFLCISSYNFIYDLQYPVLVALTDEESGYLFQFATQAIIDNNQPRKSAVEPLDFETQENRICKNTATPFTVYAFKEGPTGSLIPVEGADISLRCVEATCAIGKTEKQPTGEIALTKKIPPCVNALLTAEKEGLYPGKSFVSTNQQGSASVVMDEMFTRLFTIKVNEGGHIRDPLATEQVVFELTELEKGFSTLITSPGEERQLTLIPGYYDVKSYIIDDSPFQITIEPKTVKHCVTNPMGKVLGVLLGQEEEKCFETTIPGMALEQAIKGGSHFEWEVSAAELASASQITFFTIADSPPTNLDDLADIYERIDKRADTNYPEMK